MAILDWKESIGWSCVKANSYKQVIYPKVYSLSTVIQNKIRANISFIILVNSYNNEKQITCEEREVRNLGQIQDAN